jgi:CBS domain-containing protein
MKVRDVMTTEIVSVPPELPLKEVIDRLVHAEVSGVPVVDAIGNLVGMITESDLISKEAYGNRRRRALSLLADVLSGQAHLWAAKAAGSVAADVMTRNVIVCSPTEEIRSAARRMLEHRIKRMPVLEHGVLVGLVSRHDILATFDRPDELVSNDVRHALAKDPNRPDDHHVDVSVKDGIVTLTGDVRYGWDEPVVVSIVREVPGVIDVVSHLHHRLSNPRSSTDTWVFGPRV